jgi:hypothetical protein
MLQNDKLNSIKSKYNLNEALMKLHLKENIKQDPIIYKDIIKNLEESENILNNIRNQLKIAKERSLNITLEVQDIDNVIKKEKIIELNSANSFYQDNIKLNKNIESNINNNNDTATIIHNTKIKIESNKIFDFE